jgi:protein-L-isoaspartate(D-aspartate) O-methyltransferase
VLKADIPAHKPEIMFWLLSCVVLFLFFPVPAQETDDFQQKREKMVRLQIKNRGVRNPLVLQAMAAVNRHLFVPPALAGEAYEDRPLPIGSGQTISQPYMVAYMTEVIRPTPAARVLEVGTGSGYQTAVLAEIIRQVYSIEIVPELGREAAKRLQHLGYRNVQVKIGDGYHGWKEQAPFDAIVVTAAAEYIPQPLVAQLKEGGRMVIPIGKQYMPQKLMLVEIKKGKVLTRNLMPVAFVPFTRDK